MADSVEKRLTELLEAWERGSAGAPEVLKAAERAAEAAAAAAVKPETWWDFLDITRKPRFLAALDSDALRHRWAELCFRIVRLADYDLDRLLRRRAAEHPDRTYLQRKVRGRDERWSYRRVLELLEATAAGLAGLVPGPPRVAVFSHNSLETATCDLACLMHRYLVTPLNPNLDEATLRWIFQRLDINIVVTRSAGLLETVMRVNSRLDPPARVVVAGDNGAGEGAVRWEEVVARGTETRRGRPAGPVPWDSPATVMFTSGSTGHAKGVVFTLYNLVTKRFARAAALPDVGDDEVFFCFLPLYHTFGRFLELQGALFWGGTYIFADNPSLDALREGLWTYEPTGLISVPHRWRQLHQECSAVMDRETNAERRQRAFRTIVGHRLRWGLSAAGYLEPNIFRFFQRHGVDLCSGFGMTEATGGITMTPPGRYEEGTVGLPLPGIQVRLRENGELMITGPYVARYLDDALPDDGWLPTGDIFRRRPSGYLEIVDRVKDVYKNSKGQTIAPGYIEQRFAGVPGFARAFVVGDGREYNVLLIVPDEEEPVIRGADPERRAEYFGHMISLVNRDLPPPERILRFAVLPRDFRQELGELTPKGSYRRKVIEEHFADFIQPLYREEATRLSLPGLEVVIPEWIFREMGVLATDVTARGESLVNTRTGQTLEIAQTEEGLLLGDFVYRDWRDRRVDLGSFARNPALWLGNTTLFEFLPCRRGPDNAMVPAAIPIRIAHAARGPSAPKLAAGRGKTLTNHLDSDLLAAHRTAAEALLGRGSRAAQATARLGELLLQAPPQLADILRTRLEALADHPDEEVRCRAYEALLYDETVEESSARLPSFLLSGKTFLNEESIERISAFPLGARRLEALRRRLQVYREQLQWPVNAAIREQLGRVFSLLHRFTRHHPEFYGAVRGELIQWVLHGDRDREVGEAARRELQDLVAWYESRLAEVYGAAPRDRRRKLAFQEGLSAEEIRRISEVLLEPGFLEQSLILAHGVPDPGLSEDEEQVVWVSRVFSFQHRDLFRVSVHSREGKHFNLLLSLHPTDDIAALRENVYWMIALGWRVGTVPVVRRVGSYRSALGAVSMALLDDLTVWERVREFAGESYTTLRPQPSFWRDLFVRGMSVFFAGWLHSGKRIVPTPIAPWNVVVPTQDFRREARILWIGECRRYDDPLSLFLPMHRNFLTQTAAHYPRIARQLSENWLFEACLEGLGVAEGSQLLRQLRHVLQRHSDLETLRTKLDDFLAGLEREYYRPLALRHAIARYDEWVTENSDASPQARRAQVRHLLRLYRLERYGELARFHLYRETYFKNLGDPSAATFDRLLQRMFETGSIASSLAEFQEFRSSVEGMENRLAVGEMLFGPEKRNIPIDLTTKTPESSEWIVSTEIRDARGQSFIVREPKDPAEVGRVYRLLAESDFPIHFSENERCLVLVDPAERICGGVCYRPLDRQTVRMDALVVAPWLKGRGLGGALLEEFCDRMSTQGVQCIHTLYVSRDFLRSHGFKVHRDWGGLVRFLSPHAPEGEG
ncbi:MAG: hypothetical protein Kow00109_03250 [Acidobacteriota bacterium]